MSKTTSIEPRFLTGRDRRMLDELCRLDSVDDQEALKRAVRLAFFARVVPGELVEQMITTRSRPDEQSQWYATGELRVDEHGRFVAERIDDDGATKWVQASEAEIDSFYARASRRKV